MGFLFSKKQERNHKVYKILGIKIKIRTKENEPIKVEQAPKLRCLTAKEEHRYLKLLADTNNLTIDKKVWFLSQLFYCHAGYFPNFKNPRSLNEKVNWLRLNYYNPIEVLCNDKYEFKNYIKEVLGDGYTVPVYGVYEDVNDIDFDKLPNQFVIKTTTNSTGRGITLVKDKSQLDIDRLKYDYNDYLQDWHIAYKPFLFAQNPKVKPRIIIEEYLPIREGKATEYKMFCFQGEMKYCLIEIGFFGKTPTRAVYDANFNNLPFRIGTIKHVSNVEKPKEYDKMVEIAKTLSAKFPHVRVDFYVVDGKIYVGELTFKSGGGFSKYFPREWDYKLGEYLELDKIPQEFINLQEGFTMPTGANK